MRDAARRLQRAFKGALPAFCLPRPRARIASNNVLPGLRRKGPRASLPENSLSTNVRAGAIGCARAS
eukprot:6258317-Pyramimonas_sp.AAC.1